MVVRVGNQVARGDGHILGGQMARGVLAGRTGIARIIGVLAIILLTGSSAFGQFVVQPMKLVVPAQPGRRTPVEVRLENTTRDTIQKVDLRLADITQDANGVWQAIEPDALVTDGPNGAKLVNVGTTTSPNLVDISKLRSCQSWLRLMRKSVEIRPLNREPVQLILDVPSGTQGYYCAALLAQTLLGQQMVEGYMSDVVLEFVVPIIVEVQGRLVKQAVQLTDVGLEFRPQDERTEAATLVTLSVKNDGGTYSILRGYARIWGKLGAHWRKIADREFTGDISIIPGAEFSMKTDVGCALGAGDYKVEGYLFVDGAQGPAFGKELTFSGDPRVRGPVKGTGALDLDPMEVIVECGPGQTRFSSLLVVNAYEEAVDVTVSVGLPDQMVDRATDTLRGDQFDCSSWLKVDPLSFRLEGKQRFNLKILSEMPADATNPTYYAMIRLHARHVADGQEAGRTDSRICIVNKKIPGNILIQGFPMRLAELTPSRYSVVAQFGNYGSTHVQPSCRAFLTAIPSNEVIKTFNLSNDVLSQGGLLLPLETRNFRGVMDVSGVADGSYRLTAILMNGRDQSAMKQTGLVVTTTTSGKEVRQTELAGPPVEIKL
jgi:hypothetical protein